MEEGREFRRTFPPGPFLLHLLAWRPFDPHPYSLALLVVSGVTEMLLPSPEGFLLPRLLTGELKIVGTSDSSASPPFRSPPGRDAQTQSSQYVHVGCFQSRRDRESEKRHKQEDATRRDVPSSLLASDGVSVSPRDRASRK